VTLLYSSEQEEYRRAVRRFLEEHAPEPRIREWTMSESGFDRALWRKMASGLGLPGLLVPEEDGGSNAGPMEVVAAFEEAGRAIFAGPLLATAVLSVAALAASGDGPIERGLLGEIASGFVCVALAEREFRLRRQGAQARPRRGVWALDGFATHVISGQDAEVLLVPAETDVGMSLFAVDRRDGAEVGISPLVSLDQTRRQADVFFDDCPALLVGTVGGARAAMEQALIFGTLALAAEAVGGSEKVLETSVEYATERIQFGRPIGSFQAIKHRCADMKLLLEASRAAVMGSADGLQGLDSDGYFDVSVAKLYACGAFFRVAADNLQIHGGIGCTWEHSAHLYLRRAKSLEHLIGPSCEHRSLIATRLGLGRVF
jgi:alkylation response protein AidB-like acyl-CoA dehydrogenase